VLVVVIIIGYFLYQRNHFFQRSDHSKPYSTAIINERRDIQKGRNTWPTITKAKLQLESVDNIDRIRIIIEKAQDDKRNISYKYEWFRNSKPFGINDDNVTEFKKGNRIDVKVTPFDGKQYGQPVFLNMNIAHVPPKVVENKTISFDGNVLSYQVKAIDPDGGTLSYSLINPLKEVTIDGETGMITWHVKANDHDKYDVNVMIKSNSGAEVIYPLSIDIGKLIGEQRTQIPCLDHCS